MRKRFFSLPNGKRTTSVDRYVRAYRKLAKPMIKTWPHYEALSYDPGVQFGPIAFGNKDSIALYEALTKKKYTC